MRLDDALWLPREEQLRALLGSRFRRLESTSDGFAVVLHAPDERHERPDPEDAYATAVLSVLQPAR